MTRLLVSLLLLSALVNALVIKRAPQNVGDPDPSTPTSSSVVDPNASAPVASVAASSSSTDSPTSTTEPPSTPTDSANPSFDFSGCSSPTVCQDGLVTFAAAGGCDPSIEFRGNDCINACTGPNGVVDGVQAEVDSIISSYTAACAASGTCIIVSYKYLPQTCRDKYPLVSDADPYGWDKTFICGGDTNQDAPATVDGRPGVCVRGSGGTPGSYDCVATQCNALLVRASPNFPNPCLPDTVTLANGCDACGGATINTDGGLQAFVSTLGDWCRAAPRCVDLNSGSAITDGACASVSSVGGSESTTINQGGFSTTTTIVDSTTPTEAGTTPTVMTIDGTPTTVFTSASDSISPSSSPMITTIDGVAYTLTLGSSAQTTTLPNGSILTLPPASSASSASVIRPSINGGNVGGSGTRTANTAFASARPTAAASAMRARGGWVVMGVTLVLGFTL